MATDGKLLAGYVLLGVGALLIVVAIVLIIFLLQRRRKKKKFKRSSSPDTFKIVYKVPTIDGVATKMASDPLDGRSVMTLRSEPGYRYVAPPSERPVSPVVLSAPPIVASPQPFFSSSQTLPRAASVDHVAVTLPRTGQRFIVPAPNGTLPKILVPVSKKKAKQMKKAARERSRYAYGSHAASVISAPAYVTSPRSVTSVNRNYSLYDSTPNLADAQYTHPVLRYDTRGRLFTDDAFGRSSHVQNWLAVDQPTSASDVDVGRPRSRASSAPTDIEQVNLNALHARWSPSMRRRLDEMDETEREHLALTRQQTEDAVSADANRSNQPNRYSELAMEF